MKNKTIKELIKEEYASLSTIGQKIGKFVIDNYEQSMLLSSVELAQAVGVSNTSTIRFARSLGFSGFLEYKNTLKLEYSSSQKVYSYLNKMGPVGRDGYISNYLNSSLEDLADFIRLLDRQVLDNFSKAIGQAENIYIMGIGSDESLVHFLWNYLNLMDFKSIPVVEEGLTLREKIFLIDKSDILILSAFPSLTEDEKWASKYAREKGAHVLVITDSELTANLLGAHYYVALMEKSDVFFNSYIIPMAFCNALLLRLYEMYPERTSKSMEKYQNMLSF